MAVSEDVLVQLLKESLEAFMLRKGSLDGKLCETTAYRFRLPLSHANLPIFKTAAEYGLIDVATSAEEGRNLEIKISGVESAGEVLGPDHIRSKNLPPNVSKGFLDRVGRHCQDAVRIINDFLGSRDADDQKFLIDDQVFSVAEEHKDVELPNNVPSKEDLHKILDSTAEHYVKESFKPYPTGMLLTKGDGLFPDTGHPTPLIKKLYGMGLVDLLGPKGNGDILMCLDTDKVDVKVKTSALMWELGFYEKLEGEVQGIAPYRRSVVREWARDSIKRGILAGERFTESTDQPGETFEMTNHEEFVEVPASEYDPNSEPLPTWASHRSSDLQLGSQLCTKDGRRCGNAVVAAVWINPHGTRIYDIITDAGNVIHAEACEVREMFHLPEYVMKDEWVAEITERVKSDD